MSIYYTTGTQVNKNKNDHTLPVANFENNLYVYLCYSYCRTCESCGNSTGNKQEILEDPLPSVLIIHLCRYTKASGKVTDPVRIPHILHLASCYPQALAGWPLYRLCAVLVSVHIQ